MKLEWDNHSDQPYVIKDKKLKKEISKKYRWDSFKLLITNIFVFPLCFIHFLLFPTKKVDSSTYNFFGISINLDKDNTKTRELINELNVKSLLIRIPLSDIENIESYLQFASQYKDHDLLINILQDRLNIENKKSLEASLNKIFTTFSPLTKRFQLGNAINRKKWAIFSMDEFLQFYKVGYSLRNDKFPDIKLLGSSVIDFEYYFSIRTLFNFTKIKYDQFSSLLYVDRRGAPENTQIGLDLTKKLHLMHSMLRLTNKSSNEIVITETNWPISNTAPYAPTSENDCVSLDQQASYLVRYYLLALASNVVKNVYWHQLIAPGYGLIDDRNNQFIKYPSFFAFKTMIMYLQGSHFHSLTTINNVYKAKFTNNFNSIEVFWLTEYTDKNDIHDLTIDSTIQYMIDRDGNHIQDAYVKISESPIYIITKITT